MVPSTDPATEEAHEMLSTKIRTTVVSIAAAFSIAVAVVPSAASAAPNTGAFSKSAEGMKMKQYNPCQSLRSAYNTATEMYVNDQKEGDLAGAKVDNEIREGINERGRSMGCWV
jgi:hypothetical protein